MVGYTLERPNPNSIFLGVSGGCSLGATQHCAASGEKAECVLSLSRRDFDNSFVLPFVHLLPILRVAPETTVARSLAGSVAVLSAIRK
jgi:hypothetical protein